MNILSRLMPYPEVLLPSTHFKKISTSDVITLSVCRTVPNAEMLEVRRDAILCENPMEFFDYSTNLPGHFELEHNFITLIGENRKYFRKYWDFNENVNIPVADQDFKIDGSKGYFFLPIGKVHNQLKFPFQKPPRNFDDAITATVEHTPTNSNFWHFSIRWLNRAGDKINSSDSVWKNRLVGTMRAALLELLEVEEPVIIRLADNSYQRSGST